MKKYKKVLPGILMLATCLAATYSSVKAQVVLLKSDKGGRGYFMTGLQFLTMEDLNSELREFGYPEVPDYLVSIGGGGDFVFNRWVLGGEGHSLIGNTNAESNFNTSLMMGYGMAKVGYKVIEDYMFEFYPSIGFGGGGMTMEIFEDQQLSFDDIMNDPARSASLSTGGWLLDVGINTMFNIGMTDNAERNIYSRGGFLLGLSAGYLFSPFENEWMLHDNDVSGGPEVGVDGFYVRLKIGAGGYTRYDEVDDE